MQHQVTEEIEQKKYREWGKALAKGELGVCLREGELTKKRWMRKMVRAQALIIKRLTQTHKHIHRALFFICVIAYQLSPTHPTHPRAALTILGLSPGHRAPFTTTISSLFTSRWRGSTGCVSVCVAGSMGEWGDNGVRGIRDGWWGHRFMSVCVLTLCPLCPWEAS